MKIAAVVVSLFALAAFSVAQACPYSGGKEMISALEQAPDIELTASPVIRKKNLLVDVTVLPEDQEEAAN